MNLVVTEEPRILSVEVSADAITAQPADGRAISVPLAWSWRLSEATLEERQHFEIIGVGQGVHWPDVDEDISAAGMLYGTPARRAGSAAGRMGKAQRAHQPPSPVPIASTLRAGSIPAMASGSDAPHPGSYRPARTHRDKEL
jgi:hypothetical protein